MPNAAWPTASIWPNARAWPNGPSTTPPPAGLVHWFNGASANFSDYSGAVPAVAPYGRVARVDQPAPAAAGSWLTPDQTTSRGWQDPTGVDLQYGSQCYFNQPAGLSVPANKCVWGFAFQFRGAPTSAAFFSVFTGNDGVGEFGLNILAGSLIIYSKAGLNLTVGPVVPADAAVYGWIQYAASLVTWAITVNGTAYTGSFADTPPTGATSSVQIGKYRTSYTQCGVAQLLGYDNTSGTVDTTALLAYLATQIESPPTTAPLVVATGDSIGAGALVAPELTQFYLAQANLAAIATPPRMFNTSVGGATIADIAGHYAAWVQPLFSSSRAKNIICVEGITNSMPCAAGAEAATAAAVLAALYAYCDQARSDGWIVILWTCLPRSDASAGTGFPGCWAIVNTDIRANHGSHSDDFADVASVPGMSLITDASGPNFVDALHPSASGHALIEPTVRAAIQRQL